MANLKDTIDLIQKGQRLSAETLNRPVESLADQVDIKFSEFELVMQEGLTPAEKVKLAGIAVGATANRADSENADKVHTHTTAQVVGLDSALDNKVDTVAGKGLSSNDFTTTLKDKLDSIAPGAQANVNADWTASTGDSQILNKPTLGTVASLNTGDAGEEIRTNTQAETFFVAKVAGKELSDENYTTADKDKVAGIQAGAQVNAVTTVSGRSGAVILAKGDVELSNVDNTSDINKPLSTATESALSGKVDKQDGKGLSDTNFTQAEKDKLSSLEGSKFVGLFVSEGTLPLSGSEGNYANVDGGVGSDVYRVIWDSSDNKWVRSQGVSTELTDAQIKQQYESNPDTNAFTDDEKVKLVSVANNATANRSDSENADKVHTHTTAQVTGLDTALAGKADKTTQVIAGTGLTGGGDLSANRTLAVSYGTAAGTSAQGNDSRITGALQKSQVVQVKGTSTTNVMSQKATTDAIANIPSVPKSAVYTVVAADKGASIDTSAGVTIPASVFAVGDVIVVTNTSASGISITPASGVTFRLAGTASSGWRTLAGYGVATFRMVSNNVWFASGAGLS